MTTFVNITIGEFKKAAGQFFRATMDSEIVSLDSVKSGHKCIALMYIGRSDDWTERDIYEANIILELAGKRLIKYMGEYE